MHREFKKFLNVDKTKDAQEKTSYGGNPGNANFVEFFFEPRKIKTHIE